MGKETDMAVFEFSRLKYMPAYAIKLDRDTCERLCNEDEGYVTKYNIDGNEELTHLMNTFTDNDRYTYVAFIC